MKKRIVALLLACMMLVLPILSTADVVPVEKTGDGAESSNLKNATLSFHTTTLDGKQIDSSIIKNYDLVFVNFWGEWCWPCVSELPDLAKLDKEYPNVLFLGVWYGNSKEEALATLKNAGVEYDSIEADGTLKDLLYEIEGFPTTYFFDRNGNQLQDYVGSRSYDTWKALIDYFLSLVEKKPETEDAVLLNGASLTLEGQITINFFLQVPAGSSAKTVKLTYEKGGTKTYTLDKGQKYYDSKNDEYKLAFPNIPAKEMTVPVTLKVYDADGNQLPLEHYKLGKLDNDAYSYCVADWARNKIADSGSKADTVYLAKALLNYGDYAQKYFKYNTANPANPEGYLIPEMIGTEANPRNDAQIPEGAKEKVGYSGASLILEGATSIRLYFTQKVDATDLGGNSYPLYQSGSEWYVEIPNIASKDLDQKYSVVINKNGERYVFNYSALSYANGRLTNAKAKDDIKNLCKALYLYNDAANEYFK